jgi:hypothetical protein
MSRDRHGREAGTHIERVLLLPLILMGCASTPTTRSTDLMLDSQADFQSILTQPFNDFNLTRTEIPAKLSGITPAPYAPLSPSGCPEMTAEIGELDKILGPDLQGEKTESEKPIISMESAERTARSTARGAASSWIPFRGFVRELTGAERHARAVREAVLAGMVRRAYLKGLAEALQCPKRSE